jgi:hypothetical protein
MATLKIVYDPTGPAYTLHYTSGPAATEEEHEAQHAKYFGILRDLLQKRGVDVRGVRLEVTRVPCEPMPEEMPAVPVSPVRTLTDAR